MGHVLARVLVLVKRAAIQSARVGVILVVWGLVKNIANTLVLVIALIPAAVLVWAAQTTEEVAIPEVQVAVIAVAVVKIHAQVGVNRPVKMDVKKHVQLLVKGHAVLLVLENAMKGAKELVTRVAQVAATLRAKVLATLDVHRVLVHVVPRVRVVGETAMVAVLV